MYNKCARTNRIYERAFNIDKTGGHSGAGVKYAHVNTGIYILAISPPGRGGILSKLKNREEFAGLEKE